MAKRPAEPYKPSIPPLQFEEWPRWIDGELHRIEQALVSNPMGMAVNGSGSMPIGTSLQTITLGLGDNPIIELPEGYWNPVTAEWTCPLDGMYTITCSASIDAFGSGNKTYYGQLEMFQDDVAVVPKQVDGGADDVPLGMSLSYPRIILAGTRLRMEMGTLPEQFSGTSPYDYSLSYVRTASL